MKSRLRVILAALALPALAHASSFQTHTSLFNHFPFFVGIDAGNVAQATNFDAPIGVGTLSYNGPRLEDGYQDYSTVAALSSFQIEISFLIDDTTFIFNDSHITSDTSNLQIYLANGAFHFSGPGNGLDGGSINFVNGGIGVSFSPRGVPFYTYILYDDSDGLGLPISFGLYGTTETAFTGSVVPEPASAAALAGLGMLGLAATRRRRAA